MLEYAKGSMPARVRIANLPGTVPDPQPTCRFPDSGRSRFYSITLVVRSRIESGMLMPSALAVLRLMTSSKFVGC